MQQLNETFLGYTITCKDCTRTFIWDSLRRKRCDRCRKAHRTAYFKSIDTGRKRRRREALKLKGAGA